MIAKILVTELVTHEVKRFVLEKPRGYSFVPGQATRVAINKPKWEKEKRPLTFTSLNEDPNLELIVKAYPLDKYPSHRGMTEQLHKLVPGDGLILEKPWGTISYKKPGVFVAGGAGITPFIAIFRQLTKDGKLEGNKLIFSNRMEKDVILKKELSSMFGDEGLVLTLTREKVGGCESGRVNEDFLKRHVSDFSQDFYICGPRQMVEDLKKILMKLGAGTKSVVFEK
jgi:ferredoxin-NADP reductase